MPDYDYDTLPVWYIRHLMHVSREGLMELAEHNLVAQHWTNIHSRDPEDYREEMSGSGAENAVDGIENFNEIDFSGAIMASYYGNDYRGRRGVHKNKIFAGVIPPDTFDYAEFEKINGDTGVYKTLQFDADTVTEIRMTDRPDIFSDVPARGAINPCRKTEDRLRTIVDPNKTPSKTGPEHLSPDQYEHVCAQYLSLIEYPGEFYTVSPVGGEDDQLELIDINGGVGERPVVAQVTTTSGLETVESKLDDLAAGSWDDADVYFFGPQRSAEDLQGKYESVQYIGDQDVFDALEESPKTRPMLDRSLRR